MWFVKLVKFLLKALFFLLKVALSLAPVILIAWVLYKVGLL